MIATRDDAAFVGRRDELRLLTDELSRADGAASRLVLVEGTPGMGKTALLRRFAELAREHGEVWDCLCEEHEQTVSYGVVGGLLAALEGGRGEREDPLAAEGDSRSRGGRGRPHSRR